MANYEYMLVTEILDKVKRRKLNLVTIQRRFVWSEQKICDFFDSMMRDYPVGTCIFWSLTGKEIKENGLIINSFIKDYDEMSSRRGKPVEIKSDESEYIAVLDGQQRITSLYMGFYGSYIKRKKGKKKNKLSSYISTYLCIDVLMPLDASLDRKYHFKFIEENEYNKLKEVNVDNNKRFEYWVPVNCILETDFDSVDYVEKIEERITNENFSFDIQKRKAARKILDTLELMFISTGKLYAYTAKRKNLKEVANIFIRINKNGKNITEAELILTSIGGERPNEDLYVKIDDAKEKIYNATNSDSNRFEVDEDFILKAMLYHTRADSISLTDLKNWTSDNIEKIEKNWDAVVDSICVTLRYLEYLSLPISKLTSSNLVLPISYYFYINKITDADKHFNSLSRKSLRNKYDKIFIKQWVLRAMINSLFRDGIGKTLIKIRDVIDTSQEKCFPLKNFMDLENKIMGYDNNKKMIINDDNIEDILNTEYKSKLVYPILLELTGKTYNNNLHIDHLWSKSLLLDDNFLKKELGTKYELEHEQYKDNCQKLSNLWIVNKHINWNKYNHIFKNWIIKNYGDDKEKLHKLCEENLIPENIGYEFNNFIEFLEKRREVIKKKLKKILPEDYAEILKNYHLN